MSDNKYYISLRINPDSSKQEIKRAYRRMALLYHPDRNPSSIAAKRFLEITEAYDALMTNEPSPIAAAHPYRKEPSYAKDTSESKERIRQTEARADKKRKEKAAKKEAFKKSKLYDVYLFYRYLIRLLALAFSIAAIVTPFILAIIIEPVVLAASFFFVIIGSFLLWHIISKRKTWFKLGQFNASPNAITALFKKPSAQRSNGFCYYTKGRASGKPYKVGLVEILDTKKYFFGNTKHQSKDKRKSMSVFIPRSARAQYIHKICAFARISIIILSMFFLPINSIIWRMVAGIFAAAIISSITLLITRVKAKASYLYTPAFLIKLITWISVLYSISYFGPNLNIELSEYKYVAIAGLIFLLDMLFDLVTCFFPFYKKLFIPIPKQGKILTSYYKKGYQNYTKYPIVSTFYPLYLWLI